MERATLLKSLLAGLVLGCSYPASSAGFGYSIHIFERTGVTSSFASGLNDHGQVVGRANTTNPIVPLQAFLTDGTTMNLLTYQLHNTFGVAVNNSGVVVGRATHPSDGTEIAFRHDGTTGSLLGTLGGDNSQAYAINHLGQVVGEAELSNGVSRAFIWDGNSMQGLPIPAATSSAAFGINDTGTIVGWGFVGGDTYVPFVIAGGMYQDLPVDGTYTSFGSAEAINRGGTIVGQEANLTDARGVIWRDGQRGLLGTLGGDSAGGFAINEFDQVVGSVAGLTGFNRAVIAGAQGMHDLNDFLEEPLGGGVLTAAVGINRHGQIAAQLGFGVPARAVLLTPVGTINWIATDGGDLHDGSRWDSGVGQGPSRFLDLVLASPASQTVTLSQDAEVLSLTLGGSSGGVVTLSLANGAVLHGELVIEARGVLGGDGGINGDVLNRGTVRPSLLGSTFVDRAYALTNEGLITGSGLLDANMINASGGEVRVAAGERLRIFGDSHLNAGLAEVRDGGEWEIGGTLVNRGGTLRVDEGTLRFRDGLANQSDLFISFGGANLFGSINNQAGARIIGSGGNDTTFWDAVTNNGEVRASAGSRFVYFGPVNGAGTFTTNGTGAYHRFEDGYSPGNSAADVVLGDFQLASALTMEIGGTTPGSEHDRITFTGSVLLDSGAALAVVLLDDFEPALGQVFDLFVFSQAPQGTFDSLLLPVLAPGLLWDTSLLYSEGDLRIALVPEPSTWFSMLAGLCMLFALGCARSSRLVALSKSAKRCEHSC